MKKTDTKSRLQQNKDKLYQGTQRRTLEKSTLKEEILQVINENFIEMLLDMVNQNVQEALKKFQEDKNKQYEKIQKQKNEIIEALNKCQTETETTINRELIVTKAIPALNPSVAFCLAVSPHLAYAPVIYHEFLIRRILTGMSYHGL
jgi:hypothetical protein